MFAVLVRVYAFEPDSDRQCVYSTRDKAEEWAKELSH